MTAARMKTPVRASELTGRAWLNTGGRELDLQALRGKIVTLDFWSFCCINCLHVLDELRPLEEKYADVLVTVGVHSPKFEHEADTRDSSPWTWPSPERCATMYPSGSTTTRVGHARAV